MLYVVPIDRKRDKKKKKFSFNAILKKAYEEGDRNMWFTNLEEEFILPEVNEEGYSEAILWKVMKYFGPYLQVGSHQVPFESDMQIEKKQKKEPSFQKIKKKKNRKSIYHR